MLRLIGMLTGSALAIAVLIVAVGVPRLAAPDPEPVAAAPIETSGTDVAIPEPAATGLEPEAEPEPLPEPEPEPEPAAALVEQVFAPEPAIEEKWYAFWSPFRSELAANGFVARLQDATGIDYRVLKVGTGVYEVAFAYSDEADIEAKLQRIADATGLDMTGG